MDREAILLAEYAEAGQCCRAQESYVRATLSMYLVLSASIAALMVSVPMSMTVRAFICFAAFAVGFCMLLLVLRHRKLYAAFAGHARAIETVVAYPFTPMSSQRFQVPARQLQRQYRHSLSVESHVSFCWLPFCSHARYRAHAI